jgi:hypothetical protein
MKFRKKPIVIEAIQVTGKNLEEIFAFTGAPEIEQDFFGPEVIIHTLEGDMKASIGDWIIKGVNGEFYPCKPDIFDKTYERVEE